MSCEALAVEVMMVKDRGVLGNNAMFDILLHFLSSKYTKLYGL